MPVYRYSQDGLRRMVTRAGRQSFIFSGTIVAGAVVATGFSSGWYAVREMWQFLAVLGGIVAALYYFGHTRKVRKVGQSLSLALAADSLTVSSSQLTLVIPREEVTAFGTIKEGLHLCGRDLNHLLILQRELENFDDLHARLEEWVPASVPRTHRGPAFGYSLWAVILGPVALMFAALSVNDPIRGAILSLTAAAVLLGVIAWAWLSPVLPAKAKWFSLVALLPILSLLNRVYLLLAQP
jgi:hypothetical protein